VIAAIGARDGFNDHGAPAVIGFLVSLAALAGSWLVVGRAWRRWDMTARARFMAREGPVEDRPHLRIAVWWLACSAVSACALLGISGVRSPAWLITAIALAAGTAMLVFVKEIGDLRDRLYA